MSRDEVTNAAVSAGIGVLLVGQGLALWIGALAHTGVPVDLGAIVIAEPRIPPALVVEGVTGAFLLGSSVAVFTRKPWAWTAAIGAQGLALGGVLLGMTAIAVGAGPHTTMNAIFHRVMALLLAGGVGVTLLPRVREAIRGGPMGHGNVD